MASLQASTLLSSNCPSLMYTSSGRTINATLHVPKFLKVRLSPEIPSSTANIFLEDINVMESFKAITQDVKTAGNLTMEDEGQRLATSELYMILEAVADRVEMHKNIGEQRNNWNTLLLNSINMITLAATTMAGIAATSCSMGIPILALKLSSTLLFTSATGLLAVMNKIQPSQLAEEQRNASKLFKQLYNEIKTIIALRNPTLTDVKAVMEKVLALDKAYPLPLLGNMLEKFPEELKPARWWPSNSQVVHNGKQMNGTTLKRNNNGWNEELEMEMRNIVQVLKNKDAEDYVRLGNLALKLNKVLAISGPLLTGIATIGSAFVGSPSRIGSCAVIAATLCGSLASVVNSLEHGEQVGMVFEMYRNCAGYFQQLEESIESTLQERQVERRENGELFEMKVAVQLGRSLSQLRELARKSSSCRRDGSAVDEFASKLF